MKECVELIIMTRFSEYPKNFNMKTILASEHEFSISTIYIVSIGDTILQDYYSTFWRGFSTIAM